MRAATLILPALVGATLPAREPATLAFRHWLGGQEVGGSSVLTRQDGAAREIRTREWMELTRLGQTIRQEVDQTARKAADGSLTFQWRLQLSTEPFEGQAQWSPREPGVLRLQPARGSALTQKVPEGAALWPEDLEERLKEAARKLQPIRTVTFSFPVQQWSTLELEPRGSAPLPGFPDTVRFTGTERQGSASTPVEVWVSPSAGELRHRAELGGLEVLTQRAGLPAPAGRPPAGDLFDRSLQKLPPHPLRPWVPEWILRAEGPPPNLPEDAQQVRLAPNRWRLRGSTPPTAREAAQPPLTGPAGPEEVRYLASTPLVPFQDPAFEGLIRRMALPKGLSRWDLAKRVTSFVFEWITDKDFSVGFASALEACRHPRGDCTEHGVLAVALLRRLGVPARGVTGWVALDDLLGLHFWVEVHLGDRWVPVDPTFDQAPASALRIKLADSDLADLGSVGWEGAAQAFSGVVWVPESPTGPTCQGDLLAGPGPLRLRVPGGTWHLSGGSLRLGSWRVEAVTRPGESQLRGARRLAGAQSLRQGWWDPASHTLWMDLRGGRWLRVEGIAEAEAFGLLDQLMASTGDSEAAS